MRSTLPNTNQPRIPHSEYHYIYANFYLTANNLTTTTSILASFVVCDVFLLSNCDLQNIMFVLNSWQYIKLQ